MPYLGPKFQALIIMLCNKMCRILTLSSPSPNPPNMPVAHKSAELH